MQFFLLFFFFGINWSNINLMQHDYAIYVANYWIDLHRQHMWEADNTVVGLLCMHQVPARLKHNAAVVVSCVDSQSILYCGSPNLEIASRCITHNDVSECNFIQIHKWNLFVWCNLNQHSCSSYTANAAGASIKPAVLLRPGKGAAQHLCWRLPSLPTCSVCPHM